MKYILSIDQSTSGTKALLLDENGALLGRADLPHEQKINERGWVSHDPMEIYRNTINVVKILIDTQRISVSQIAALGISNQRETALIWDRNTGEPIADAVVWQCGRAQPICDRLEAHAEAVRKKTGLRLSPYFPAAKWAWILENAPDISGRDLCAGTIDSWLIFKLTGNFKTDYSNASRTQLFNINTLSWDEDLCKLFGVASDMLPEVCMSDSHFGNTDIGGVLPEKIRIYGVLGDSHGALFGQGCVKPGMGKATYGTGSSVMVNIGEKPVFSGRGLVTSLAWGMGGRVSYVLEGNINYTGSVIKWLTDDVKLLGSSKEAGKIAAAADLNDSTYLVPAFTGLGAPYWKSDARAVICGMGRSTGRAEIVKAAEESIGFQIADIVNAMAREGVALTELRADGGPTRDSYLMQFQSDILGIPVAVPEREELSGIGAGYCAGIAAGLYVNDIYSQMNFKAYIPEQSGEWRERRLNGWKNAIDMLL